MILRNVELSWAKLTPDHLDLNGNYSVTFTISAEQEKEMQKAFQAVCEKVGKTMDKMQWFGTRKELEFGRVEYTAKTKTSFVDKKTNATKEKVVRVYDKHARLFESIPNIANGAIGNIEFNPFYSQFQKKQGISLGLNSLQLLKYEEFGGENPYKDESGDNAFDSEQNADDVF